MNVAIAVVVVVGVAVIAAAVWSHVLTNRKSSELGAVATVSVDKYLAGLPSGNAAVSSVVCAVTEDEFVFLAEFGRELGRIPRDRITQVLVEDKSRVTQRLTVPRMLALGVFSLAYPKKEKQEEYCLVIDWSDGKGIRHNSVFEFTGPLCNNRANSAANKLLMYAKPRA